MQRKLSAKHISQREARRLRRRVAELEQRERDTLNAWASGWPGGVHVCEFANLSDWGKGRLSMARACGRVLVARLDGDKLVIHAVEVPRG